MKLEAATLVYKEYYVFVEVGIAIENCVIVLCRNIEREQFAIENCEEPISVVSVCESKEKLGKFFFSRETYTKGFGVSSREFVEC